MVKLKNLLFELKMQVFSLRSGKQIDLNKIPKGRLKIKNNTRINKPEGAFWTSTQNRYGSDWIDYAKYNFPLDDKSVSALLLKPKSSKILYISNDKDYDDVYEKFPNKKEKKQKWLDWEKISKKYDGVNVSGDSLRRRDLQYWDVESTAWFNMNALKIDKIIDID